MSLPVTQPPGSAHDRAESAERSRRNDVERAVWMLARHTPTIHMTAEERAQLEQRLYDNLGILG